MAGNGKNIRKSLKDLHRSSRNKVTFDDLIPNLCASFVKELGEDPSLVRGGLGNQDGAGHKPVDLRSASRPLLPEESSAEHSRYFSSAELTYCHRRHLACQPERLTTARSISLGQTAHQMVFPGATRLSDAFGELKRPIQLLPVANRSTALAGHLKRIACQVADPGLKTHQGILMHARVRSISEKVTFPQGLNRVAPIYRYFVSIDCAQSPQAPIFGALRTLAEKERRKDR